MNKFLKKYRALSRLGVVVLFAVAVSLLGAPALGITLLCLFQLLEFAMSKRRVNCYRISALTDDQIKEFETATKAAGKFISDNTKLFEGLHHKDNGLEALQKLPALMSAQSLRVDELQGELKKLRKSAALYHGSTGVRWIGNQPFVTDDCARALTSVFVLDCAKLGENAMRQLNREARSHEGLITIAREFLGIETKAALTGTEIPLPTVYVPQIVELVWKYGQARQYCTVYPLGAGVVKLPRLKAGEDDFGFLGVGTAGMSQSVTERRVAAELVTFTANKAGGLISIPTEIEEDTFIPFGQFLARYIARQLAKLEDKTVFIADGTGTYANILGVCPYCAANGYSVQLAAGKTKPSDATLASLRKMRSLVSDAVLNGGQGAYYMKPTMEGLLVTFNTIGAPLVYQRQYGTSPATLDGFPIRWIGVGQGYSEIAAPTTFIAFFGDISYVYLGERGTIRVEVSKEVFFATDELAMRALERIDVEIMAVDAMSALETAAA